MLLSEAVNVSGLINSSLHISGGALLSVLSDNSLVEQISVLIKR
jgi:hypothetical protein